MANIADIAGSTRGSIGRYFSLVSFIPSAFLVSYIFVLLSSGALYHSPDLGSVVRAVSRLGLADVAALTFASVGLGLVLHPLQFAFVQFFEGYWGTWSVAQHARSARMWWHWRRLEALRDRANNADSQLPRNGGIRDDKTLRHEIIIVSLRDEALRQSADQPRNFRLIMPTRLGNVLRYYESSAGLPYQLDAIGVMPYLARVAPAEDMAYVNDQRSNLDLAVRMILVSAIAFVTSFVLLWHYGLWLLVAIVPYALAYLSYRGAVVAASAYGRAFAAIIALNRFALYERLHLPLPRSTSAERRKNQVLGNILGYSGHDSLRYKHPET